MRNSSPSIYQASKILDSWNGKGRATPPDSMGAIARAQSDDTGSGRRFATAITEMCNYLTSRGNRVP